MFFGALYAVVRMSLEVNATLFKADKNGYEAISTFT
jgi:hypothetical protein